MIYFCADDYGVSEQSNNRIEECLKNSVLNKISVLPNGELGEFNNLISSDAVLSLHLNLVEGFPLSKQATVSLLTTKQGNFKYSFIGLFFASLLPNRKELEKQLYLEIKNQIDLWRSLVGENKPILIDSHQHTHMIPLIFKTLLKVIKDENVQVECLRFHSEPIKPYVLTPSLYFKYGVSGLIKQWLLKILGIINFKELKRAKINYALFMGVLFSGKMTEDKIKKVLPKYLKIAEKHNLDIEIGLHPGYLQKGESLIEGTRKDFNKFYLSPWRKKEFDNLLNFK